MGRQQSEDVPREEKYWATKKAEELIPNLESRRKDFEDHLVTCGLRDRIDRSWRYYHGLFHSDSSPSGLAIQMGDEEGGTALAGVNHFRSNIDLAVTYIAAEKPAWNARARAEGNKARRQTILAGELLDAHLEVNRADGHFVRAARHAMILSMGFLYLYWDWIKGDTIRPDEEGKKEYKAGGLSFANPTILNSFWDYTLAEWDRMQWIDVELYENRYDLLKRYGKRSRPYEAILAAPSAGRRDGSQLGQIGIRGDLTDLIAIRHFWHKDTPALSGGRFFAYIPGSDVALEDGDNEYGCLPVAPLAFGEFLLTCMGYTTSFDAQVPQEWFNASVSTQLTILNTLGIPRMYVHEDDEPRIDELEPGSGIAIVKAKVEPKVLDFYSRGADGIAENMQIATQQMEMMTGANPVSRGQPEGELKGASGTALQLLDSKTHQANTIPIKIYKLFLARVGTIALKILQKRATDPRVTALTGEGNLTRLIEWSSEDLQDIDRVEVEVENPMMRSISGRVELADMLAEKEWITTRQEYLTVLQTGQVKSLTDAVESQLAAIADENERLLKNADVNEQLLQALEQAGSMQDLELVKSLLQELGVVVLRTDNHILHIRRNISILDTTEVRLNRGIAIPTMAHVWCHRQLIMDPEIQREQLLLGYLTGEQLQSFIQSMQIPGGAPPPGPPGLPPPAEEPQGGGILAEPSPEGEPAPPGIAPTPMERAGQSPRGAPRGEMIPLGART